MHSTKSIVLKSRRLLLLKSFSSRAKRALPNDGLTLSDFSSTKPTVDFNLQSDPIQEGKRFHIKTYGCQMNVNDSDIVRALLKEDGWTEAPEEGEANLLLTNTCAIREGAERKVWQRLRYLKKQKKIVGVLGCMAERLSTKLLEDGLADLVVGPDAYRDLPRLASQLIDDGDSSLQLYNTQLSLEETYADITPIRARNSVAAFLSIQRGCANRCSFCIVPFTRGQERSRPFHSVLDEAQSLFETGVREITLLGQNVNSYHDRSEAALQDRPETHYTMSNDGFRSRIRRPTGGYHFADLVAAVSDISPELRVRFTSPHPKDYPPSLLHLMAERPNICNHLHMPAQSGSTTMLRRMKRGYTREAYLELMDSIHDIIPDVALSTDMIAGFCGESEEEHADSLSLLRQVRYDHAFLFAYSLREKTHADRSPSLIDDVPEDVKNKRLRELIDTYQTQVHRKNEENEVGRLRLVLLEGESKRSAPGDRKWSGRTSQNKRIVVPVDNETPAAVDHTTMSPWLDSIMSDIPSIPSPLAEGDYAVCHVTEAKGHTLRGRILWKSSVAAFAPLEARLWREPTLARALLDRLF